MKTRKTKPRSSLQRMVRRLARVSEDMRKLGADMDYYGGFGLLGDRGREMLGAARMAKGWIKHLAKIARIVGGEGKRAQNVKPPNDLKLSDGGAWRGSCVVERSEGIRATEKGGPQ